MPEHDVNNKERILGGQTTEPPSSDAYIAGQIRAIRQEIEATDGRIVDVPEDDILTPQVTSIRTGSPSSTGLSDKPAVTKLTPEHSALAFALRQERLGKKAA
ncbi:hypothetical protein HYU92_03120 [Candidatus Curtissbacteria bacterium]|nr:hypothetical protein [Candidatus Curtissbacteria bacterium]